MADAEKGGPNEVLTCGQRIKRFFMAHWKGVVILLAPIVFSPIFILNFDSVAFRCLYIVAVMATYWITEAIPLGVTSMIPVVYFPIAGVLNSEDTCKVYLKDTMFMFVGGLMFAVAIEFSNLHKRVALRTMKTIGCSPRRLHLGMTLVTTFLSMWISNAAATAMMCPIIQAVLVELQEQGVSNINDDTKELADDEPPYPSKTTIAFYLSVCYASSIGGSATLIGTSTSLTLRGIYDSRFPESEESLDFPRFMLYAVPGAFIITLGTYVWMEFLFMGLFRPSSEDAQRNKVTPEGLAVAERVVDDKLKELGRITVHELNILVLFVLLITMFFTRNPGIFTGWSSLFPITVKSSAPAILIVVLLFLLPINFSYCRYCFNKPPFPTKAISSLMNWPLIHQKVPWELIFLLGGGFALSEGSKSSGMAKMVGDSLKPISNLPRTILLLIVILVSETLTAFSSNTAIANILLPIFAEMSLNLKIHPLFLMFPSALACSMAFHLPVSTPPNAIAAKYANIRSKDMAVAGIGPTILSIIVIWVMAQTYGVLVYPAMLEFPSWPTD